MYKHKSGDARDFRSITNPKGLYNRIKNRVIALIDERNQQRLFESNIGNMGKVGNKSEQQK